jgi:AraC-like DNA-binding protein
MSGTQRLINLLELAAQGPAMRAALAEEVAELLIAWPTDCPAEMRTTCEALLARAAREVDEDTRARLRIRLYADPALAGRVLPREAQDRALIEAARRGEIVLPRIARALGVSERQASDILGDESGHALAAAAKALGLNRAAFSGLAMLVQARDDVAACYRRLDAYDAISAVEASRELRRWSDETLHAA